MKKFNRQTKLANGDIFIQCRICDESKISDDFPNHKECLYGKDTRCKECRKTYLSKYHAEHRDVILSSRVEYHKKYREENREAVRIRQKKYKKTLKARLSNNLRTRIHHALKGLTKSDATIELVGCDIDFLKNYLEAKFTEGMTWATYGKDKTGWEIDHIKPCASFDLSKPEQQQKCFNYTNLQPLWANDNMSKGHKYDYITN